MNVRPNGVPSHHTELLGCYCHSDQGSFRACFFFPDSFPSHLTPTGALFRCILAFIWLNVPVWLEFFLFFSISPSQGGPGCEYCRITRADFQNALGFNPLMKFGSKSEQESHAGHPAHPTSSHWLSKADEPFIFCLFVALNSPLMGKCNVCTSRVNTDYPTEQTCTAVKNNTRKPVC